MFPVAYAQANFKGEWFSGKQVRGVNWLADLLKRLSAAAALSEMYTNHCVRATVVTKLHDSGMANANIRAITGHRSDESVERYMRVQTDANVEAAPRNLSNAMAEPCRVGNDRGRNSEKKQISADNRTFTLELEDIGEEAGGSDMTSAEGALKANGVTFTNCTNCTFNIYIHEEVKHGKMTDIGNVLKRYE